MTNATPTVPNSLRRLNTSSAAELAALAATFEDLQTALRCCERLVAALAVTGESPDDVLIESVWTVALLSYARCFSAKGASDPLTEADVTAAVEGKDVLDWHKVLLQLRDHHADAATNPREQFSVGVAQADDGSPEAIAITSTRQPLVDEVTVRQTGAIAYALSRLVNDRIAAQQQNVFHDVKGISRAELDTLTVIDVSPPE